MINKILILGVIVGFLGFTNVSFSEISVPKLIKEENLSLPLNSHNFLREKGEEAFYNQSGLKGKLSYSIYKKAMKGYKKIKYKDIDSMIIVDYSKDSTEKRFYFLDLKNGHLKYLTYVAHGKNTGFEKAVSFSNQLNSYKSSVGFYRTGEHYKGRYGYSVKLHGLEDGVNSNSLKRTIVIHGAKEAEESYIKKYGFLGRTEGCFGLPLSLSNEIMGKINNNTVLFAYGEDENYLEKSWYLK